MLVNESPAGWRCSRRFGNARERLWSTLVGANIYAAIVILYTFSIVAQGLNVDAFTIHRSCCKLFPLRC